MSHTAHIHVEFRDPTALAQACQDLGATITPNTEIRFHDGTTVTGTAISLPGWRYPVVVSNNQLYMDDYQGAWGNLGVLKHLRQLYTVHATTRAAARMGRKVIKREDRNSRIRLTLA